MMTPVTSGAGGAPPSASGSSENPWDTIQQIVAGAIGTKLQGRHIGNWHLANQLFLGSQKLGKDMGLSEEIMRQIAPFPPVPSNNTFILNENPAMAELLAQVLAAQQPQPQPTAPAAPAPAPAPAPTPVVASVAEQAPPAAKVAGWKRYLWPAIAAAGLAAAGGTAVALWPDAPPPVTADYEVTVR